jgi:Na+/H+ antiporter NhaD/arsenite permease-like protein
MTLQATPRHMTSVNLISSLWWMNKLSSTCEVEQKDFLKLQTVFFPKALVLACAAIGALTFALFLPGTAFAANASHESGASLSLLWMLPFACLLLSIAILPLAAHSFWHQHYGIVALFWALMFIIPFGVVFGASHLTDAILHAAFLEYIPFIILIGSLYTIAGGIYISGNLHGSPLVNTAILATGTALASFVGTTGASVVLIRPLLRANDDRGHNVHAVVFFIFLVSNIGGSLTPLGDPPLFLGFLKGIDFFWPIGHMLAPTLILVAILLTVFFIIDAYIYRKEGHNRPDPTPDALPLRVRGSLNVFLMIALLGAVLASGYFTWLGEVNILGTHVPISGLLRDVTLVLLALASLYFSPDANRHANNFSWEPVLEVAKLFAAIFITIIPAIAILQSGEKGAMAPLLKLLTNADQSHNASAYFWLTGTLSSFLDNAPTYLIFFNSAGGNPVELQGIFVNTLLAVSAGAVYMGAMTYIGNAPNFMVKSIAEHHGVPMPSFFGYMGWSTLFLVPLFVLITFIFFVG